jgi:hypothetical protein
MVIVPPKGRSALTPEMALSHTQSISSTKASANDSAPSVIQRILFFICDLINKLLSNKKIHPHEKSRWDEFIERRVTSSLSHVYFIKIFLRRYYPYQVQGFGTLRLSLLVLRANLKPFGTPDFLCRFNLALPPNWHELI